METNVNCGMTEIFQNYQLKDINNLLNIESINSDLSTINHVKKKNYSFKNKISNKKLLELKSEILDKSSNAVSIINLQGSCIYVNESFLELWNFSKSEDIQNISFIDLWESPLKIDDLLTELLYFSDYRGELIGKKSNGITFPVSIKAYTCGKKNNKLIICIIKDITELKNIKSNYIFHERVINSSLRGIVITTNENNIKYANNSFLKMFGYFNQVEVQGLNYHNLILNQVDLNDIKDSLKYTGYWIGNTIVKRKDNTSFEVQLKINRVTDESNISIGVLVTFFDLTEKKKIKAELILSNYKLFEELEIKINERKIELKDTMTKMELLNRDLKLLNKCIEYEAKYLVTLNDLLTKTENDLKLINDSKNKFFPLIAHDLKNSIQGLILTSELLLRNTTDIENERIQQKIYKINKICNEIVGLIENLLTWSKSRTGIIEFKPQWINISKIIDECKNIFSFALIKNNLKIVYENTNNVDIWADRNLLKIILRNLISNAIKFSKINSNIDISIVKYNGYIQIIIKDYGIGLTNDDKEHLFRIDFTNRQLNKNNEGGTGLGLIISNEFINMHNGTITVESEREKGSSFILSIPQPD